MPFDPFFSSAKQHAKFCEGEQELWDKIHAMPKWERKKELALWRGREMTQAERNVRRRISIALRYKSKGIHIRTALRHKRSRDCAAHTLGTNVYSGGGFETSSNVNGSVQGRAFKSK